jgi:hypothetical protein
MPRRMSENEGELCHPETAKRGDVSKCVNCAEPAAPAKSANLELLHPKNVERRDDFMRP